MTNALNGIINREWGAQGLGIESEDGYAIRSELPSAGNICTEVKELELTRQRSYACVSLCMCRYALSVGELPQWNGDST